MGIQWSKQTYADLKGFWERLDNTAAATEEVLARRVRYENIEAMLVPDRIWPPLASKARSQLERALREVLSRLPENEFYEVESRVWFVLEDPSCPAAAVNVPRGPEAADMVIFYQGSLSYGSDALIGLVAHEIAHSFVRGKDYAGDEALADAKVREWGFARELDCLRKEQAMAKPIEAGSTKT